MICTDAERARLHRIVGKLEQLAWWEEECGSDHEAELARADAEWLRAIIAQNAESTAPPDDAVVRDAIAAVIATRIIHPNAVYMNGPFRSRSEQDRCEWAADEIVAVLRGVATRDESQ